MRAVRVIPATTPGLPEMAPRDDEDGWYFLKRGCFAEIHIDEVPGSIELSARVNAGEPDHPWQCTRTSHPDSEVHVCLPLDVSTGKGVPADFVIVWGGE